MSESRSRLTKKDARALVLRGIAEGRPLAGPMTVHIDVTNSCNAACITCWDHSPLLSEPRAAEWKRRRLDRTVFADLTADLDRLGAVRSIILSGMGDPLVHPDIYEMIAMVKERSWQLTMLSNLIAADIDRLARSGVDQLLVGVHGASPATYAAFHPGWGEKQFFTLCQYLRRLASAGVRCRHVQVINRDNAHELTEMVRFGKSFRADRVNFKLASLRDGTEACSITEHQCDALLAEGVPAARRAAEELGVATNLDLFSQQLGAAYKDKELRATTPIEDIGCFMGYVYTRITVDLDVLYCCNTRVRVGSLRDAGFAELWHGEAWQRLRDQMRAGQYVAGCDTCGKFEQNVKWSAAYREYAGEEAWQDAAGQGVPKPGRSRVYLPIALV